MKCIQIFVICFAVTAGSRAQSITEPTRAKKLTYTIFASAGINTLRIKPDNAQRFSNAEFRIGAGVHYKLYQFLDIKSRLALGFRLKRNATDPNSIYQTIPGVSHVFDEMTSHDNYFFYEIPVVLQFNVLRYKTGTPGIGLRGGASFRHFLPIDHVGPPYLSNDFGLLAGVQLGVTKKISITMDYYYGLTHTTSIAYTYNTDFIHLEAWNTFATIGVDYRLGK